MPREHLILCGPRPATRRPRGGGSVVRLDATPPQGNVHLRIRDITDRMVANLPPVAHDLIELAAYVYAADQATDRGNPDRFDYGKAWRRRFRFEVPVRCPGVWHSPAVSEELVRTLSFLSDDEYEFTFAPLKHPTPLPGYLEYGDGTRDAAGVEEVMLFSGGLDSLAGAVEEVLVRRRKVALVSHRPVTKIDSRQWRLAKALADQAGSGKLAPFHVPVLVNKVEELGREFTQRTRSFLFASFAAVVARLFGLSRIRFYENGIVSCNLPIAAQVLGGRASRTTHPTVLNGFERLFSRLFETPFTVENPFFWKTRTEVVDTLRAAGHAALAAQSVSCAHTWQASAGRPHCGTCSQCVDRRLATLAAKLTDAEDPADRYRVDLLTGHLDSVLAQTMVERLVGTAREVEAIPGPIQFVQRFGEASRLLGQFPGRADEVAVKLLDLHRRHAKQVNGVIERELAARFRAGNWSDLPPTCLLRIMATPQTVQGGETGFVPTRDDWLIIGALAASPTTMSQVAIEQATNVTRKTVGKRLREMHRCGIISYPHMSRKGAALTDAGRALARSGQLPRAG